MKIEPKGVGGWLLLLILGLTLFGPLRACMSLYQDMAEAERLYPILISDEKWKQFTISAWVVIAAAVALSITAGIRLANGSHASDVAFTKIALWVSGPGSIAFLRFGIEPILFGRAPAGEELTSVIVAIVSSAIAAVVWTLYLSMSVRVRNTYNLPIRAPSPPSRFRLSALWSVSNVRSEGIRRLCVALNVVGIIWAALFIAISLNVANRSRGEEWIVLAAIGVAGFAAARLVTWVISGFAAKQTAS